MEMQEYSSAPKKNAQRKKLKKYCGHVENISPFAGIIFILAIISLYGIVYLIDDISPIALYVEDEDEFLDRFIAERAQNDLKDLTSIGPRVVGTPENEILAVELLQQKIKTIIQSAHKNQKIEFDLQVVSGALNSSNLPTRVYESVQNLVVKVHATKYSEHSLLVNAHFDSNPTSPGGSDNGINCAVGLEILRKTTRCSDTLNHNVVYLFNGAEEAGLLGAHGFITQHRWAREIKSFINLDSNGAGGKIMLFQSGPKQHWLMKHMSQIAFPYAQVIGEELYESEFLQFDTDYTVFTKVAKTVGLNFAFIKNARRYHTRYDGFESIPLSTYQHVGDTVLTLVRSLANSTQLAQTYKEPLTSSIYYDCMGLFLIYYSHTIGTVINVVVSLFSVLIAVKSLYDFRVTSTKLLKYVGASLLGLVLGWFVSVAFVTIIAVSLDALHYNMVWYNNFWIILGLYVTPTFLISFAFVSLFKRWVTTDVTFNMHAQLQSHLFRLLWTLLLLIGTCFGVKSVYVILIPVFFQTLAFVLIHATCSQYTKRTWQILFFILTIPGTMYTMYILLLITSTFLPSLGHLETNAELYVAFLFFFFTILISSTYAPFVTLLRKFYMVFLTYSAIFVICLAMVFTPLTFPYSDNADSPALQRFTISYENTIVRQGLDNNIYGRSNELQVVSSDSNYKQTLQKYITEPEFVQETDMIPLNMSIKLTLNSKKFVTESQTHYNFTIEGPSKMSFTIVTEENITISYGKLYLSNKEIILKSNSTMYVINYIRGAESKPLELILKTRHSPYPNAPLLKFFLKADYLYNASDISIPYFDKYLDQFPSWTNVESRLWIWDKMVF